MISIARQKEIPTVIDADGLWLINQRPELVEGNRLAVLTPNVVEYGRLRSALVAKGSVRAEPMGTVGDAADLAEMSTALGHVIIVRKGRTDLISDGQSTLECSVNGSLKRTGGIGTSVQRPPPLQDTMPLRFSCSVAATTSAILSRFGCAKLTTPASGHLC